MILRDYQDAAVESIFSYFGEKSGNPVVAMPTGSGKSLTIADFIKQACIRYPGTRIMKLTHSKVLIKQNYESLKRHWPTAPCGIFSAGLGRKDCGFPITFGGIGSVANRDSSSFGRIDLLLIDECHLLSPNENTQYQKVIANLKTINPYLKVVGFTATNFRLGQGLLTDPGGLFTDVCFDLTTMEAFNWLIDQGYLAMLYPKRTSTYLDVSGVHTSGGEFKQGELQAAVDKAEITRAALIELLNYGGDREHWLIFATGIEHTIHVTEMLHSFGISATCVHSKMTQTEQDENLRLFKDGQYRAMVNNGILTTGFDFPDIDLLGILRPTQSTGLWVQINGRGTRPVYAPGYDLTTREGRLAAIAAGPKRQGCLVLDFAGNTPRLGPINDPVIPKKKGSKGGGSAPVKLCPHCGIYNHASARFCAACGEEFYQQVKIHASAGTSELIATSKVKIEVVPVERITYQRHSKPGKITSLRVNYYSGLRQYKEWIFLEHTGVLRARARKWWRERDLPGAEPPDTVEEAIARISQLRVPTHLKISAGEHYDDVIAYDFSNMAFEVPQ
jgi:DNA repair protein RadD